MNTDGYTQTDGQVETGWRIMQMDTDENTRISAKIKSHNVVCLVMGRKDNARYGCK